MFGDAPRFPPYYSLSLFPLSFSVSVLRTMSHGFCFRFSSFVVLTLFSLFYSVFLYSFSVSFCLSAGFQISKRCPCFCLFYFRFLFSGLCPTVSVSDFLLLSFVFFVLFRFSLFVFCFKILFLRLSGTIP